MPRPVTVQIDWRGCKLKIYTRPWKKSDDSVIREVLEQHVYERHAIKLSNSDRWLDCGAHIGTFALAAACEGCHVEAFEPHPDNYQLLLKNIKRNGFESQIRPHEAALMARPTQKTAELFLAPHSTSSHSLTTPFRSKDAVSVKIVGIEAFLKKHPSINGIKIDVEGSEMPLLESLAKRKKLLSGINQIVFEWDFKHDEETARLRQVISRLEAQGFEVRTTKQVYTEKVWKHWPSGVLVYAWRDNDSTDNSSD